ncbi:OsmC family peroxiredoxin [Patulibacter defluvii]|uniref:OsmC family peroxiredoxin n=1 Tax=Patulibacter defluvii TaxID=3095358 RepID=UPI002A75D7AE|nr:OsmC family peroxiredoxin [Patulibacter sp. DM4]
MGLKITRKAAAVWKGSVEEGEGRLSLGSGTFDGPYSLRSRVEDVPQANPEELIGAAHAGCFTMSLSNLLTEAGHPPTELRTSAQVRMEQRDSGFTITRIELKTVGEVEGVDAETFAALAQQAKDTCPVSRALAGVEEIALVVELAGAPA